MVLIKGMLEIFETERRLFEIWFQDMQRMDSDSLRIIIVRKDEIW